MTALYVLLALIGICLVIYIVRYIREFYIIMKFWYNLNCLQKLFKVYILRKSILPKYNYDYDTQFILRYTSNHISFESIGSQREIMEDLYDYVGSIDKLVTNLEETSFQKEFDTFYDLRHKIRMEKLANENTTE